MANKETVTSYHWADPNSVVRRIDVRSQSNGQSVAYLYANNDPALHQERLNIRSAIRLKGWGTLSDHHDDDFSLRVSGLRNGTDLIAMLQNERFVSAPTQQISNDIQSAVAPSTWWGKVKTNSLQWSGIFATIGNAMSFASGVHRGKDWGQMGQGLLFGVADLPLAIAGAHDDVRQLSDFLRRLKMHYDKEGIEIPKTASIYVETSDKGKSIGERSMDYMHRYANQIKCSFEVAAAVSTIHAGKNQNSSFKKYAPFIWGPGFLASLLIPERKIDEGKYAQAGPLARLWMKIQSNPLSVGGILGYSNVIANYGSAINERNRHLYPEKYPTPSDPKTGIIPLNDKYGWDFAIPTVMVGANGLYAMSKKTVGGDIKSEAMVGDAYTIAAQIINKQPEALREKAIESTAKFFAERTEIKENHAQVIERLKREVEIQRQNPWYEPLGLAPYTPVPKPHKILKSTDAAQAVTDARATVSNDNHTAAAHSEKPASIITQADLQYTRDAVAATPTHSAASIA